MASSAKPEQPCYPRRWLLLWPRTWRNRGRLVGAGSAQPRRNEGRAPAVLALHGFGATPQEVEILIEVAREQGLRAAAPVLPGHASHARDLANKTFAAWLAAARAELHTLAAHGRVIIAGMSLGGIIAARLAADEAAEVCGLALFGNALRLASPYPARWLAVAQHLYLPTAWWIPKLCADIDDPVQRERHLAYDVEPIRAGIEVYRAGIQTAARLGQITCPTLIVHGARDQVCPVSNAEWVKRALGTRNVETVILANSGHVVTEDRDRQQVASAFRAFIQQVVQSASAP